MVHNAWKPDDQGNWVYGTENCGCSVYYDKECKIWFYTVRTPTGYYPLIKANSESEAMTKSVIFLKRLIADE